ncbi:hypothetical protein KQ945_12795 [Bacillus subtilis subsp. subtilis]|nr:hypothetical protein [Bacillus subtilis subsp. subtilis]
MRLTLMLSLLLALAGCSTAPRAVDAAAPAPIVALNPGQVATGAQIEECTAAGGEVKPLGRRQSVHCVVRYDDAGKTCSTRSDCNGQCLAPDGADLEAGAQARGVCQRDISQNFGCHQRIDNGVAQGTLCVD